MKIFHIFLLSVCIILTSIPVSVQYGTIFADTVLPVNEESVHFPDTTSDVIRASTINVGNLTLSDPGGFNVNIPQLIEISSGDDISIIGELGFAIGGDNTQVLNFHVDEDLDIQSQEFFALFSEISFNIPDPEQLDSFITFDSGRYANIFANDMVNFDGSDLLSVLSVHGNTNAQAPNIIGSSSSLLLSADNSVTLMSQTGFIDLTAEESIFVQADIIDVISEQNTEMVADHRLSLIAEDTVEFTSGDHIISSLGDTTFESARNIDFTSSSGMFVDAGSIGFNADSAFYLISSEEAISQVSAIAGNRIDVIGTDSAIFGSNNIIFEIFDRQSIISNVMEFHSISSTTIGHEETNMVGFDAGQTNDLSFYLDSEPQEGDALDMESSLIDFTVSNDLHFTADRFIGTAGSSFLNIDSDATFNVNDMTFSSTAELGSLSVSSNNGQIYSADSDITLAAHTTTFSADSINAESNDITLQYDSDISISAPRVTFSALNDIDITGGETHINGDNIQFNPSTDQNLSTEINIFAGGKMDIFLDGDFEIDSDADALIQSFSGNLDMSVVNDISLNAGNFVVFNAIDESLFYVENDYEVFADNISFDNFQAYGDDDDFLSFTFGRSVVFDAPSYIMEVDDDLLFESGLDIVIGQIGDAVITSEDVFIQTLTPRDNSGITIAAIDSIISTSSVDPTTFNGFSLSFFAERYAFETPLITMTASEEMYFTAGDDILMVISDTFTLESHGHVLLDSADNVNIDISNGPLDFNAFDSINMTIVEDLDYSSNNFISTSAWFNLKAFDFFQMLIEDTLDMTASGPGGSIHFTALDDITFSNVDDVLITAPEVLFRSSSDKQITAGIGNLSIDSSEIFISGHSLDTDLSGNFAINAGGSIQYKSEEFRAFFDIESNDALYQAMNEVHFTSDGDIIMTNFDDFGQGLYSASSEDILINGMDSVYFDAGAEMTFQAELDYTITSSGATRFWSNVGDALFTSADTFDVTAGRIVMDTWKSGESAIFTAEQGDIQFDSTWGSINFDSSMGILLNATNPDATASTFLTSTAGVDISAESGGLFFNSEGFLPDSNLSFEFKSASNYGDIVFDSQLGGIQLHTLNDINYSAGNDILLNSAYGAEYVPENFMSFDAPSGLLDVNAQRGITINAGAGLDPADILFTQATGSFLMSAGNQISLHSTGVVDNESILVSGQSDIRFNTANTGDIRFFANDFLSFDATGIFSANSNNNYRAESTAGSISFTSVTNSDFVTTGGPIYFSTFSSNPGGEITLTANGGNVDFTSGNSTFLTAAQAGRFNSELGIDITSFDGSLDVLAASAGSFINLISAGGFQVTSTGNDITNDDAIWMDAVVNIEYGTATTQNIQFNAIDSVTTGTFSRPIITFNAGGSQSVFGMKIQSDGGIYTETDNQFSSSITGSLLTTTNQFNVFETTGVTSLTTIGSEGISFISDAGILRLHGTEENVINSDTKVTGASSGALEFIGIGPNAGDSITFTAPDVNVNSGISNTWSVQTLDADLTNSFTLTTSGDGIFSGTLDENSSFSFDAYDFFSGTSGLELTIDTDNGNGPIFFSTLKTTSDMTLETQPGSDIEVLAGGELGFFGNEFYLTSTGIIFSADHSDPNDNGSEGDIQIGSENTISGSNFETLLISGERSVLLETTGTEDDIGADLRLVSGGEFTISSTNTAIIRNVAGQGGSLNFDALSDILITNVDNDGWINFYADNELTLLSVRDNELTYGDYFVTVGDSMGIRTQGKNSNDDFGIRFQSDDGEISFESVFGSITFDADEQVIFSSLDDISILTDRSGLLQGSSVDLSGDDVVLTSTESSIELYGRDGVEFTSAIPNGGTSNLEFTANGVDDNNRYAMRFQADTSGPFAVNILDTDISSQGVHFIADTLNFSADNVFDINSEFGDLEIDVDESITVFSSDIDSRSSRSTFIEASVIDINAEADIEINASNEMTIETLGEQGGITLTSSGAAIFRNGNEFSATTTRRETADINFLAVLGRMEFDAGNIPNSDGYGLDFTADFGDLSILALTDDSDVYSVSSQVTFEAGNDVTFVSTFTPGTSGLVIDSGNVNIVSQTTASLTATNGIDIDSQNAILLLVDDPEGATDSAGEGGAAMISATDTINFNSNNDLDITSQQEGGHIVLTSEDDITFQAGVVSLDPEAVMKIPRNLNEFDGRPSRYANCLEGSFFWFDQYAYRAGIPFVTYPNDVGFLCVCVNGNPRCHDFWEAPCSPGEPNCNN